MAHVIAIYEIDRAFGGHEEGGWWYDCGQLTRTLATARSLEQAHRIATRANRLLARLQRDKRPVSSVAYDGGRHQAMVFDRIAPAHFPAEQPRYE
ncbi:hypothetical protein [Novosphingobium sp. 9U]|uniref:hypothetical protein n=1 Tax=Novosphingobium sp. 9U TaxID=2653158 RepID=UPI0012F1E5A5|nr:hypothetical protein [Novosphingobium sp. 9U]VWX51051.1 conserved hypothetical protein [Novosphingobium sp. 9U]